jgi:DHA1 family multidrug resistance protein-like MFS transporter
MKDRSSGRDLEGAHSESQRGFDPSWRRTLVVVGLAGFVALAGFSMVIPFMPFYIQELGVSDPDQVKIWSGLVLTGHAVTMSIFAPIWGSLADRFGRKVMLERALFSGTVVLALMAFARNAQQLVALRVLQGCLTGTSSAATALVAGVVPRERVGSALGALQMGVFAGISVGPLIGGVIADTLGYRASFLCTAACLFLAAVAVLFLVQEGFKPSYSRPDAPRTHLWIGLGRSLRSPGLRVVMAARLLVQTSMRATMPVLPLYVAALLPPSSRVATMAGVVVAISAVSSSVAAGILGRLSDRVGHQLVFVTSSVAASVFYALQAMATNLNQMMLLQAGLGMALAGTLAATLALLATLTPDGQQGSVYGVDTSVMSVANALGPLLGTSLAVMIGIRASFGLAAGMLSLASGILVLYRSLLLDRAYEI